MKLSALLVAFSVIVTSCAASPSALSTPTLKPSPTSTPSLRASPSPTAHPTASPTPAATPTSVAVTFRLSLEGSPPDDAAFALESGTEGGGGAVYLCSYYGGWPICEADGVYRERLRFAPGTVVHYAFWRELDVDGTQEMLEQGEFVVRVTDRVVDVSYSF